MLHQCVWNLRKKKKKQIQKRIRIQTIDKQISFKTKKKKYIYIYIYISYSRSVVKKGSEKISKRRIVIMPCIVASLILIHPSLSRAKAACSFMENLRPKLSHCSAPIDNFDRPNPQNSPPLYHPFLRLLIN